jgi:isopentenyl diphosphate isomerase/L-lactate dehydrogenase-like FMN-dependent dehydrogenase
VSSGGIQSAFDIAVSLALGADICAAARPLLTILKDRGQSALETTLLEWQQTIKKIMFLVGAKDIPCFQRTKHLVKNI